MTGIREWGDERMEMRWGGGGSDHAATVNKVGTLAGTASKMPANQWFWSRGWHDPTYSLKKQTNKQLSGFWGKTNCRAVREDCRIPDRTCFCHPGCDMVGGSGQKGSSRGVRICSDLGYTLNVEPVYWWSEYECERNEKDKNKSKVLPEEAEMELPLLKEGGLESSRFQGEIGSHSE